VCVCDVGRLSECAHSDDVTETVEDRQEVMTCRRYGWSSPPLLYADQHAIIELQQQQQQQQHQGGGVQDAAVNDGTDDATDGQRRHSRCVIYSSAAPKRENKQEIPQ